MPIIPLENFTLTNVANKIAIKPDTKPSVVPNVKPPTNTKKTKPNYLKQLLGDVKSVGQSIARSGATAWASILQPFTKQNTITADDSWSGKAQKAIFGEAPIESVQKRTDVAMKQAKDLQTQYNIPKWTGLPLVAGLVGGSLPALDFLGLGSESKQAVKVLAKLVKVEDVANVLRKLNIAEDLVTEYAPIVAKTSKQAEVGKILEHIGEVQKTTTPVATQTQNIIKTIEDVKKAKAIESTTVKPPFVTPTAKIVDLPITPTSLVPPEITPNIKFANLEKAIKKFDQTGTANVASVGKDFGVAVKDEGDYVSVRFGSNKLTPIGSVPTGERNFATKEEAFNFVKQLQQVSETTKVAQEIPQTGFEVLASEASKFKTADEFAKNVSGSKSGFLFHGTRTGNEISKFNLEHANWGVGSNAFAQGNEGIYLTDDLQAARYFSRKANEFDALMKEVPKDQIPQKLANVPENLFGDKDGNIVIVKLKPGAKIKELDFYPSTEQVKALAKEGYEGVRFPEQGLKTVQDYPVDKLGTSATGSKTTFVFNPEAIDIIKTKTKLTGLYDQVTKGLKNIPQNFKGVVFASPNIREGLNYEQASKLLTSSEHARMKEIYADLAKQTGLTTEDVSAVGDWSDGAENTIFSVVKNPKSFEDVQYLAAQFGEASNQKAVIPFFKTKTGQDSLYIVDLKGSVDNIRKDLDKLGLQYRTIIPKADGVQIVIFDQGTTLGKEINQLSKDYGTIARQQKGTGSFLGGETRAAGLKEYRRVTSEYQGRYGNPRGNRVYSGRVEATPPTPTEPITISKVGGIEQPPTNLTVGLAETKPFDPEKYVQELTKAQETARQGEELGFVGKLKAFFKDAKKKLVDFNAPMEDILNQAVKEGRATVAQQKEFTYQLDRAIGSRTLAGQFARDNGLEEVIRNVDDVKNLDQYMIAKQAKAVEANGIKTGRDLVKDQQLIDAFSSRYEVGAQKINQYTQKLLDYMVDSDLISKETADFLKQKYPEYIPLNRIFSDEELATGFGNKGVASLSKQTVVQKLVGSEREIESPMASLLQKTTDAFAQGEKNKAAKMLAGFKDIQGNPFEITALRTAENVKKRIDIFKELGASTPNKNKLERMIVTRNRWMRELQSELNKLNKQGVKEYLKRGPLERVAQKTSELVEKTKTRFATGEVRTDSDKFKIRYPESSTTTYKLKPVQVTAQETKDFVNALINDTPDAIDIIKKKIGTRDSRLSGVLDQLGSMKNNLTDIKLKRAELMDEAKLLKDAESKGKTTISVLNSGIKEIYEVPKDIAEAAKALNVQQLNVLGRIFAFPVRLAKIGITGINLPFIAANIAKDQVTAIINSKEALKTSLANPAVFVQALFEAVKHGDVYQEMARSGALGTSFDIARNQVLPTIERIRSGRSAGEKIKFLVKNPEELLRAVENIVSRGEEFTRIQQYMGTKQAELAKGVGNKAAQIAATLAARKNTVDFARRGEWGQVLNSAFLYLNANIQGTRTFIRTFKNAPLETATKLAVVGFTPIAIATAWNLSDPNRKLAYDDIAEYEKENNIIIIPPNPTKNADGTWNVIKIPISQEINNLLGMVRRPIEQAYGGNPLVVKDIANALVGSVTPIATPTDPWSWASTLTPQAIKPSLEALTNRNFFTGAPLVSQNQEKLSKNLQTKPWTSGTVIKIANAIKQSPIKVEEFIKGTTGGVGSQILNTTDHVLAGLRIIPKDQIGGQNVVKAILARFNQARGGHADDASNKQLQDLIRKQTDANFILKQEAEAVWTDLKKLPKDQANEKARELKKTNPKMYEQLKNIVEDEKLGLDYNDRLIKQLQVSNGERAKFIYETLKSYDTKEKKNAYIKELQRKKIVSGEVFKQLKELLAEKN
jgi:hypothetical protein